MIKAYCKPKEQMNNWILCPREKSGKEGRAPPMRAMVHQPGYHAS